MKWMKSIAWVSVVCACVGLAAVNAWGQGNASASASPKTLADKPVSNACACPNHVDADGDGACDNRDTKGCEQGNKRPKYVDADGDGVCDNKGVKGCEKRRDCSDYVDADGDGVCDNKGAKNCGTCKECPNRVDANGDGVCDNKGQGCGAKGRGRGQGGSGNGVCQRTRQSGGRG